jgi:hypothetical protein
MCAKVELFLLAPGVALFDMDTPPVLQHDALSSGECDSFTIHKSVFLTRHRVVVFGCCGKGSYNALQLES